MKKVDVVKNYIEKYPEHGNMTIAKLIVKEHPNLYPTLESARSGVRYARGNHGNTKRSQASHPRPNGKAGEYKIPKSLVPKKRIVHILSLIHI